MRIEWTVRANRSLEQILTCSADMYSKSLLRQLLGDLKHKEPLLADNPMMGAIEPIAEGLELEYRHLILIKPFKIIYFILDGTIFIADVWDTRRNPSALTANLI